MARPRATVGHRGTRWGNAVLDGEAAQLRDSDHERHRKTFIASLRVGSAVAGGEIDPAAAEAVLVAAAQAIGLSPKDAERHVRRGLAYGARRPRVASRGSTMVLDATEARSRAWAGLDAAITAPWSGRDANRLRVAVGLHLAAVIAGTLDLSMSHRQGAEWCGVSLSTYQSSLRKLDGKWLRIVYRPRRGDPKDTTVIRVGIVRRVAQNPNTLEAKPEGVVPGLARVTGFCAGALTSRDDPLVLPNADPWDRRPNAWRLYLLLKTSGPLTTAQLAEATGISKRTVQSNAAYMRDHALVEYDAEAYTWALAPPSAASREPFVVLDQRRRRHMEQRRAWRAALEQRSCVVAGPPPPTVDPETGEVMEMTA